jgi:Na+-driven multidrug efflux pump
MGKPIPGLLITVARLAGIAIPMAYLYVYVFELGIYGVWLGIISGNVIVSVVSLIWVNRTMRGLEKSPGVK